MDTARDTASPNPVRTVALVILIAFGAGALVTATHEFSKDRIALNERQRTLDKLQTVLDPNLDAGDLSTVEISVTDESLGADDEPVSVFVMLADIGPLAAVFTAIAPDGYNGPIHMLVGLTPDGRITGVRVIDHRETPGLGDVIEADKSDWAKQFVGTSANSPAENEWRVNKDGGVFDALTGATVTPRAVVAALHRTLIYYQSHSRQLFARAASTLESDSNDD